MMEVYYIYCTTNLINNKKYIGKHKGLLDDSYLGSGLLITRAIKKYGRENFKKEILHISQTEEENQRMEKYYIELFNAVNSDEYYNIAEGGQGGNTIAGYSEEMKRATYAKRGRFSIKRYGHIPSEETRAKLRESSLRYWTEDRRKERSIKYTGAGNPMYGKHHTEETKEKIRKNTDYLSYRTEAYSKKMSEATKGEKNGNYGNIGEKAKNGKQVYMYDENHVLMRVFNTKRMALDFLGIKTHDGINKAIKNNTLYKGYYWSQQN